MHDGHLHQLHTAKLARAPVRPVVTERAEAQRHAARSPRSAIARVPAYPVGWPMTEIERRAFVTSIRAQGRRLVGYAATFGTPAEIGTRGPTISW